MRTVIRHPEDAVALKAWRGRHGLTQPDAAAELGVSLDHLQALERGRFRLSLTVKRLMSALDKIARRDK